MRRSSRLATLFASGLMPTALVLAGTQIGELRPGWRELKLRPEKLEEVRLQTEEALRRGLKGRAGKLVCKAPTPQIVTNGKGIEAVFPPVDLEVGGLEVGGIPLEGTLRLEGLRLDYGRLGVGKLRLNGPVRLTPDLKSSEASVKGYLTRQGFRDSYVKTKTAGEIVLGGRRPVRVLLFRTNPTIDISGKFVVEGTALRFEKGDIEVRNTSGPVASAIQRKIRGEPERKFDFADSLAAFPGVDLEVAPGQIRIVDGDQAIFEQVLLPSAAGLGDAASPTLTGD